MEDEPKSFSNRGGVRNILLATWSGAGRRVATPVIFLARHRNPGRDGGARRALPQRLRGPRTWQI